MIYLPLLLVASHMALVACSPLLTFEDTDPATGVAVTCDRCPPGSYMRRRCSSTQKSDCAPCPQGSYTEVWNHIHKCLRCSVCGRNQVVKSECTASGDCQCQCKPGYYFNKDYDMCVRHSECPSGHGVLTAGTPDLDTVCLACTDGSFSDVSSAVHNCTDHRTCSDAGMQLLLRGSIWHDSLCAESANLKDGAEYLREILPAFFFHHKFNSKRLRRIVQRLPNDQDCHNLIPSDSSTSELLVKINTWAASAPPSEIRKLPTILTKLGVNAGDRLKSKLDRIDANLSIFGNEVVV